MQVTTGERPREDAGRRRLSASPGRGLRRNQPCGSQTSSLQDAAINFCCASCRVSGTLSRRPQQTHAGWKKSPLRRVPANSRLSGAGMA